MRTLTNKGFSLIELMIVVAIIGILAAIAVPNFQKFQLKAKQTEAKGSLSGLFTAEKSYMAEYSEYSARLDAVGWMAEGAANYNVGFNADLGAPANPNAPKGTAACIATCPKVCVAAFQASLTCIPNTSGAAIPAAAVVVAGPPYTFTAAAVSKFAAMGGTQDDQWTIDQNKSLSSLQSGL